MPGRMLRPAVFDSSRFIELADNRAQVCYLACIPAADDFGNLEAGLGDLRRRWRDFGADSLDEVARILALLVAADLLRTYESGGKRYAHIPRFRQRLRSVHRAHPRPPADKDDYEINVPAPDLSDACQTDDGQTSDACRTLVGPKKEGRKEGRSSKTARKGRPVDNFSAELTAGPKGNGRQDAGHVNGKSNGKAHGPQRLDLGAALAKGIKPPTGWRTNPQAAATYAGSLGMSTMPGESLPQLVARVDRVLALRDA